MERTIIILPVLFLLVFGIPILIGVYVYRDAAKRGMNALLWALVAVFAPSLIGLIIYVLVRGNYSELKCPACFEPVKEEYTVCPNCGAKLRPFCPKCSAPVESDWKVCPRCAQPLPEVQDDIMPPVRPKDRTFWKVLLIIILIPVLLIVFLLFFRFTAVTGGSVSLSQITFDEYFEEQEDSEISETVAKWIESLDGGTDHAYALMYEYDSNNGGSYFFLIYVPGAGNSHSTSFGQSSGLLGPTIRLELTYTGNSGSLYCVQSSADSAPDLRITVNGRKIRCDVTTVDFNPTLYFIVPQHHPAPPAGSAFEE